MRGYDQRALDGVLGLQSRQVHVLSTLTNGGNVDIDPRNDAIDLALTQNAILSFSGPAPTQYQEIRVLLRQDATGGWTVTWPSSVTWAGTSVPVPSTAANTVFVVRLVTADGGATWLGVAPAVSSDTIWDAAGDLVVGTGADTATRLAVDTVGGKSLSSDPNATNKLSWSYAQGVEERYRGTGSFLATTVNRKFGGAAVNTAILSTGRISLTEIQLPKGLSITTITFYSMTTALSVGANQWFALLDLNLAKLAVTADDTSTAWAANTAKTLTITGGPWVTTYAGIYYLAIMVKATTPPSLATATVFGDPAPGAVQRNGDSSLTNPASCPSTVTIAGGSAAACAYAGVS